MIQVVRMDIFIELDFNPIVIKYQPLNICHFASWIEARGKQLLEG